MDPLTAFGLASNVVSFVSFASDLFKTSLEVYSSASGSTEDVVLLDTIYSSLRGLSTKLQSTCEYRLTEAEVRVGPQDLVRDAAIAVKRLAEVCKKDCDELSEVTARLQVKDSSGFRRKWGSFRIALRKVWEQRKIDQLEDRLLKTQVGLTMHIGTISGTFSKAHHESYMKLQSRSIKMQLDQYEGLQAVKRSLSALDHTIQLSLVRDTEPIKQADVECLDQQLKQLSLSQDLLKKEQRFLSTLQFKARPLRHDAISEAHENTFRWLLEDNLGDSYIPTSTESVEATQDRTTLVEWLQAMNGIFWVTGKPGCGKSTLMKFVAGAQKTHSILSRWASPVVMATHYFWSSGSPMQRSQEGLLRTLLYDIFRQHPTLIPVVCKEQWRQLDIFHETGPFWSLSSLSEALSKISEKSTEIKLNFCFFIDGLDEFEGDHDGYFELCRTMCKLSQSPHIKICLSSRPWNVFEEAFSKMPKIYVHNLTWNDIRNYAASRLQDHPRWLEITRSFSGQWLIDEIANRSSGVFLWVFLVAKLLREGMTNRDRFPDLRRRLESFPCELEDFFKQILNSVEPIYHAKTASLLRIALTAKEPLSMVIYDFHDLEHDDEDYFLSIPMSPFTSEDEAEIYERVVYHLNSRTRGLLEVSSPSAPVTFLHRTVKDYLATQPLMDFLQANIRKPSGHEFIPELSILRAYAAWIKRAIPQEFQRNGWAMYTVPPPNNVLNGIKGGIRDLTIAMIPYAAQLDAERHLDSSLAKILDDVDSSVATMILSARTCMDFTSGRAWNPKMFFREYLAEGYVKRYVIAKDNQDPVFTSDDRRRWCLRDSSEGLLVTQPRSFNGSGKLITRSTPIKRRKPKIGRRLGPKANERVAVSLESSTGESPAKRRRRV